MSAVVTGEAVALDLRTASFVTRALAAAIDLVVQFALLLGLLFGVGVASGVLDDAVLGALALLEVVGVAVGYPLLFETLTHGRSLGKLAFGLRVVRDDGGPERFRHALVRALVGFGEFYLTSGSAALISSLVSEQGKRLGDRLAGTVVVRERVPAVGGPLPVVPPWLAGWAAELELSAVPDALALEVRTFLTRAPMLTAESRTRLSHELGDAVAARVTPPPPPGMPAEVYLAAVLAERRSRELRRLLPPAGPGGYPPGPPPPAVPPRSSMPPPSPPMSSAPPRDGFRPPG